MSSVFAMIVREMQENSLHPKRHTGQRASADLLDAIKNAINEGMSVNNAKRTFHVSHRIVRRALEN